MASPASSEKEPAAPELTPVDLVEADQHDAELLAKLGYKQELKRNFSTLEVFGISFSIISLLPSIASTLAYSIPAGPVGMVWVRSKHRHIANNTLTNIQGWFIPAGFIFLVGIAMVESLEPVGIRNSAKRNRLNWHRLNPLQAVFTGGHSTMRPRKFENLCAFSLGTLIH